LLFGQKYRALRRAFAGRLHGSDVSGAYFEIVADVLAEDRAAHQRRQNFGQQQVWHGLEAVSGGRVSLNGNAQAAQLLHQAPDFRACGADLGGDLCSADYYSRVIIQQTNDAAQARVGLGGSDTFNSIQGGPGSADCGDFLDGEIMSQVGRKDKSSTAEARASPPVHCVNLQNVFEQWETGEDARRSIAILI